MPFYEYQCSACRHELEALQKLSDAPLSLCPACNTYNLVKKISAPGFRLSGGGWYETDYKSGNKKNLVDAGDSSKPATSSEKPAAAPKDAAPAASSSKE
ncbi:MAG TPA: zinc ribbon domain-containing protein [Cellvibrionaceae bacterium]